MINIVLVEPEIPQNTGNIARTCAATGAALHLVGPLGFSIDDRKLKRAGLDYWHLLNITHYDSLNDFLSVHGDDRLWLFTTKAKRIYSSADLASDDDLFLVFGKETAGLPEELLVSRPDTCLRIPMINEARSLNLSNSVAVAVFEALRQRGFPHLLTEGKLHRLSW